MVCLIISPILQWFNNISAFAFRKIFFQSSDITMTHAVRRKKYYHFNNLFIIHPASDDRVAYAETLAKLGADWVAKLR